MLPVMSELYELLVGISIIVGPVIVVSVLLNHRDRRESRLKGMITALVNSPTLLGLVAIKTRCSVLLPRSVITVDVRGCLDEEIWEVIERLSRGLPQAVQGKTTLRFVTKRPWSPMVKILPRKNHQLWDRTSCTELSGLPITV
jgi:hypothetical protein